jgi:Ca2+-binding EF-hand superfamily protein
MRRFSYLTTCLLALLLSGLTLAQTATTTTQVQGKRGKLTKQEKKIGKAIGKLDQDRDGQISRAEWTRKSKAFDRIDSDHDNYISRKEFLAFRQQRRKR